jgi:hypothetical protein
MSKITFEIEKEVYELPEFLSIDDYVKVYRVKDFLGEEYFQAKLIHSITGAKVNKILTSSHAEINYISNYLLSLFPDNSYPFYDTFELDGIEYGFIPSWKKMSFAEFIDLDTLMNKQPKDIIENLHIICSIMYRPITTKKGKHEFEIEKYDMDTMEERAELFKKRLDVKYVLGGQFFFSRFAAQYSSYFPQSLIQRSKSFMKKMVLTWKMRKIIWKILLNKPSDGLQSSIDYAMITLQDIQRSQRLPFWKRSINFFTFWRKKKK